MSCVRGSPGSLAADGERGRRMYGLVERYAALGEHRCGTAADEATVDWFAATLESFDATVLREPLSFERYDARWSLTVDGEEVVSIPLFYEGTGDVVSDTPLVTKVGVRGGSAVTDYAAVAERALEEGATIGVLATDVAGGFLCAVNRRNRRGSGLPTLCVAGRDHERLSEGRVLAEISARVVPGPTANVRARLGQGPDESRVLLTTPLSGWFRCAGERGTGIAVCLEVARELARDGPVTVLGTSGHELGGFGVRRHLESGPTPEKAIFHFGASVASGDADGVHAPASRTRGLRPTAWAGDDRAAALEDALSTLGVPVRVLSDDEAPDPRNWVGESVAWAPLRKPLVSIAGGFALHHAPEDLPHLATTPQLLAESFDAALAAARVLATVPGR